MKNFLGFCGILLFSSLAEANTYINADSSDFYDLGDFYYADPNQSLSNNGFEEQDWHKTYNQEYDSRTSHWGSHLK